MSIRQILIFTVLVPILGVTAGCGRDEDTKIATQVAARVNADEITVHQVNDVLARNPNISPEAADQAKREILNRLIDQQLAKQKAIENKLDRSPKVMRTLEAAKSEILALAYQEQIATSLPKPVPVEIHEYYKQHPELFAQRKVFNLEELAFVANKEVAHAVREQLSKARSLQEFADWLQSQGVKLAANRGVRAAEQISLDMLPKVQAMKEGETQLFEVDGLRFQVIRVMASKTVPVDEASATPYIQQFLAKRNLTEALAKEMKKVKEQAKIEYLGEFAGGSTAAEAKVKPPPEVQPKSGEPSKDRPQK